MDVLEFTLKYEMNKRLKKAAKEREKRYIVNPLSNEFTYQINSSYNLWD